MLARWKRASFSSPGRTRIVEQGKQLRPLNQNLAQPVHPTLQGGARRGEQRGPRLAHQGARHHAAWQPVTATRTERGDGQHATVVRIEPIHRGSAKSSMVVGARVLLEAVHLVFDTAARGCARQNSFIAHAFDAARLKHGLDAQVGLVRRAARR